MSAAVQRNQSGGEQVAPAAASNEQNNNNNSDHHQSLKGDDGGGSKRDASKTGLAATRKRASVQSNLSAASTNGHQSHKNSCSATTSGSSQAGDDDDDEPDEGRAQMSNAEYEHIRNKTLLFFLDRLYLASQEGKEARTLHDLSCLFGTREFTKEMRQIVGASRNGLKKFLQSYPSLFQIEGDKVLLTQLKGGAAVSQRDYNKEAVEYFKQKLLQFGSSLVPIKNLFGYRSQASQEVRHVSGKNSRDFKRFLKQNEDVFEILADEHVVLKSALRELESQGMSSLSLQQSLQPVPAEEATTMDPYLNKQLAHLIEDFIRQMIAEQRPPVPEDQFRVTLERLHERIQQHCQNELFLKMVKTVEDLRVFLRMHPKLFKRFPVAQAKQESGLDDDSSLVSSLSATTCYVGLLSESERRDLESQAYQASSLLQRQHSTLGQQAATKQPATTEPAPATTPATATSDDRPAKGEQHSQRQQPASPPVEVRSQAFASDELARERAKPIKSDKTAVVNQSRPNQTVSTVNNKKPDSSGGNQEKQSPKQQQPQRQQSQANDKQAPQGQSSNQSASHKLRANAPPFVPSKPQTAAASLQHQSVASSNPQHPLVTRQNSLLAQPYRQPPLVANSPNASRQRAAPAPIQRSLSNLNPGGQYQDQPASYNKRQTELPPFDRRSAIRSYLMKGNAGGSSHNMNWGQQQQQALRGPASANQPPDTIGSKQRHHPQWPLTAAVNNAALDGPAAMVAGQEDLRARTVDIVREASNIITKIMTTTDAVAFDCKGYNLGFDGKITLIQFGFLPSKQVDPMQLATSMNKRFASSAPTAASVPPKQPPPSSTAAAQATTENNENQDDEQTTKARQLKPEVCVFDLITNPELAYCLKPLLESDKVVKIVHDVRNKSNALHVQFNIILNNVFDTQVANLVIQQQVTGKPAYKSRYISMGKLCEIYGSDELVKYRSMIKMKTSARGNSSSRGPSSSSSSSSSKDVNYWRTRPLTRAMILEATMDVYCLVGGIYQNLKSRIKPEYEPLFDLLNLEGVLARIKPEEIRSAKKERKIDMEVIDLKRKLYGDTMGPVVLSNREIRLLRHIDLTEGVRQKIQQCKKVAKKLERLDLKAALLKQQQQLEGAEGAADGQQPMSLNSRSSSLTSNGSSLNAANGKGGESGANNEDEQRQEQLRARLEEFNAAVMMMDSSMFDELKDTINESTSLLESLENDDDDEAQLSSGHHSHNGSSINDCCRCQCHSLQQSSLESQNAQQEPAKVPEAPVSAADAATAHGVPIECEASSNGYEPETVQEDGGAENGTDIPGPQLDDSSKLRDSKPSDRQPQQSELQGSEPGGGDESDDSKSSACDMAVQCDLLS